MERGAQGAAKTSDLCCNGGSRTLNPECGDLHDRLIFVDLYILGAQLAIHESRGGSPGGSKVIYAMSE
ncbi:MAG: hypothetical protein C5S49_06350 [Candidatus Methanogaster sp.]|nr:MAG: hypothetical protein C5S49_06350 [ANME-2 cluster archaeon]